jgi:hypothetical protein
MAKKTEPAPRDAASKDVLGMEGRDPTAESGDGRSPTAESGEARAEAPICPYCAVPCKANRTEPLFTRYYCPTVGCTYSQKVVRPEWQKRLSRQRQKEEAKTDFSARD